MEHQARHTECTQGKVVGSPAQAREVVRREVIIAAGNKQQVDGGIIGPEYAPVGMG